MLKKLVGRDVAAMAGTRTYVQPGHAFENGVIVANIRGCDMAGGASNNRNVVARIVVFHGHPNPPDAIAGNSIKFTRHVLPTPWVAERWK